MQLSQGGASQPGTPGAAPTAARPHIRPPRAGRRHEAAPRRAPRAGYLLREAPNASTMGSAISIMDCSVDVTTMKRMMLSRKVRCRTCRSSSPVCSASSSSVTPSVTPLHGVGCEAGAPSAPNAAVPCRDPAGDAPRPPHAPGRAHLCMTLPFWKAPKPSR